MVICHPDLALLKFPHPYCSNRALPVMFIAIKRQGNRGESLIEASLDPFPEKFSEHHCSVVGPNSVIAPDRVGGSSFAYGPLPILMSIFNCSSGSWKPWNQRFPQARWDTSDGIHNPSNDLQVHLEVSIQQRVPLKITKGMRRKYNLIRGSNLLGQHRSTPRRSHSTLLMDVHTSCSVPKGDSSRPEMGS